MPDTEGADAHLDAGTVAAYLDDRLAPAQTSAVEAHLADCAACRAEIVQLDSIVRPRRTRRRAYLAGVALAAAAALLLFVVRSGDGLRGGAGELARAESVSVRIRALGAVTQAPIYLGVSVRAPSARGTELFATGMRAYTDARYADAVASLRDARAAGIEGASAPFFLGASLLMRNDASGAADEFARVIAMGPTTYLAEAHYYRAKALLRLNQPNDAVTALDLSIRTGEDPVKSIARLLLDSVRVARGR
jgi:anti-sigma factor RsiW